MGEKNARIPQLVAHGHAETEIQVQTQVREII